MRTPTLIVMLMLMMLMLSAPMLHAEDGGGAITVDQSVDRGLRALVKMQGADGSFSEGTGITALAGMALLAGGNTPTRGAYHEASEKALRAVIAKQDKGSGYLGGDMGNMYAHGFATLYLAESYGMAPEQPVRRALEGALDLIHYSQNKEGGWRYSPSPTDADISVTICQVMALRAAYNVGVGGRASEDALRRAIDYVRRCANGNGSFGYQPSNGGEGWGTVGAEGVPRSAAGTMCLIGAGVTDLKDRQLGPALLFLRKNFALHLKSADGYFWYGQYYAAQALFHSPEEKDWEAYWKEAWPVMVKKQDRDGLWKQVDGPGPAYATSMALIILQIPNNYLPIFQR